MNKQGNAYAAIQVIVLITILFIGYFVMIPIFGKLYSKFTDTSEFNQRYTTEESCYNRGYWDGTKCNELSAKAYNVLGNQKRTWLTVPFIFVFGLILWYWTVASKKDYQQFGGP